MTHVEYIEKLLANLEKEFEENPATNFYNPEETETFRTGCVFGIRYIIQSLKNPIDFNEE